MVFKLHSVILLFRQKDFVLQLLRPDTIIGKPINNGKTNNIILSSQKGKNIKNQIIKFCRHFCFPFHAFFLLVLSLIKRGKLIF